MARAFIGIGSNIEPAHNVRRAIRLLGRRTHLVGISMVYLTAALDRPEQAPYYNCVAEIDTEMPPVDLKFGLLRDIEQRLGRKRNADRYAPRPIDLDLIAYDNLTLDAQGIRLPDPDILERPFLALPLCELAPDLVIGGQGIEVVAAKLPQQGMQPLPDYAALLRKELGLSAPPAPITGNLAAGAP